MGVPLLRVSRCGGISGEPTKAGVAVSPVNQRCRSLAVVASVTSVTVSTPAKCTPLGVAVESVVGWALGVVWVCRCGGIPGEPTKAGVAVSPVNQRCRSLAVVASVTSVTVSTPAKCTPLGVAVESVVGWALGVVWVCRCGGIPGEPTKAGVAVSPVNQRCRSLAVVASVTSVTVSTPAKCTPLGVAVESVVGWALGVVWVCRCGGIPGEPTKAGVAVSPVNQRCRSLAVVASVTSVTVSTPAKCTPLGVAVESVVGWALGVVRVCRCGGIRCGTRSWTVVPSSSSERSAGLAVVESVVGVGVGRWSRLATTVGGFQKTRGEP